MATLLITNIGKLLQTRRTIHGPVRGSEMANVPSIDHAWLLIDQDVIEDFGSMSDQDIPRADKVIDVEGDWVFPGFCDSHTHIVFAASREEEFVMRIQGKSYQQIAEAGGGILNSARILRSTPEDELYLSAMKRLEEVIGFGTVAVEIKSGYGLDFDSEVKMLRVIKRLKEAYPVAIKSTFLGAHAIPETYKDNRVGYIRLIVEEMIPYIAGEGLADYCDVFCDKGYFTPEETGIILEAGWKYGLKPKIHANELAISGGVQIGVAHNALSVDHLEAIGKEEIECLQNSHTLPTLLPSTSFFLGLDYAPGRQLIDAGLPVVLASDYNPGSTPAGRMSFVMTLACLKMGLLPEEAFNATTINGAFAMEVEGSYGSITPGKQASIFLTKPMQSLAFVPYAFGSDLVHTIIIDGEIWDRK
jgi:imidazolonepropionase